MKLKKWLLGTVLSFCLLMNMLAMPAASAGFRNRSFLLPADEYAGDACRIGRGAG